MKSVEGVEFSLPGRWWSLDLRDSDAAVRGRINTILEEAVGRSDELAALRHGIRDALLQVASQGKAVKAHQVHIARSLVGDVPMAATLLISRPGASVPDLGDPEKTAAQMLSLIPGEDVVAIDHASLAIVRSVDRTMGMSEGEDVVANLTVNYWIAMPHGAQLVVFTFSSPLAAYEEELTTLFDAVAMTTTVTTTQGVDARN